MGAGLNQTFRVVHKKGTASFLSTMIDIGGSHATDYANQCTVSYDAGRNEFLLINEAGTGWQPAGIRVGTTDTLTNSRCTLLGASSTVEETDVTVVTTYSIQFKTAFAGRKTI